ncbi:HypC/HybG/HupF family hydrogenase formation chaperone [Candidatus Alkanophaga liquidiphilum]|nr:Hydrogenase maturation factor HybG [Candidatus Alkanophaga liquidiphilum]RLG38892.1 MAG: HypC/HybG/HupF family hydrogenase formation chaperone [Candidatus Alkanophagales archaeon]
MCLAIPAKVLEVHGDRAKVDFGGVKRDVNVTLVDVAVGQYVIVHAGFAIEVIDEEEALETLKLWEEILQLEAEPIQDDS